MILRCVVGYAVTAPPRGILKNLLETWSAKEKDEFVLKANAQTAKFWQRLRDSDLWADLSLSEFELAASTIVTMTHQQQVDASWRVEAAQVLMWALALLPQLPPYDTRADFNSLRDIPCLGDLVQRAELRDTSAIDKARDLAELWHWRSRTRTLVETGDQFIGNAKTAAAGVNSFDDIVRLTSRFAAENRQIANPIDEDFPAKEKHVAT